MRRLMVLLAVATVLAGCLGGGGALRLSEGHHLVYTTPEGRLDLYVQEVNRSGGTKTLHGVMKYGSTPEVAGFRVRGDDLAVTNWKYSVPSNVSERSYGDVVFSSGIRYVFPLTQVGDGTADRLLSSRGSASVAENPFTGAGGPAWYWRNASTVHGYAAFNLSAAEPHSLLGDRPADPAEPPYIISVSDSWPYPLLRWVKWEQRAELVNVSTGTPSFLDKSS
ncbi:MAG: hypothetical protein SV186_02940 [Candidatus Nanohaloarchaea archaeon]|nr:hypothetical protein [Candidatus Nanohaloarchaea archaeon]